MKFVKKPIVVEAVRWTNDNYREIDSFIGKSMIGISYDGRLAIKTLEGVIYATVGDWIIRGVHGEFYPCKPDIFEETYELANAVRESEERHE